QAALGNGAFDDKSDSYGLGPHIDGRCPPSSYVALRCYAICIRHYDESKQYGVSVSNPTNGGMFLRVSGPWRYPAPRIICAEQEAGYSWPQRVFIFICVAGSIAATGWIFRGLITASPMAKVSSDDLFLCLWLAGMLVACLAVFLGGSARYLLPACPVLLLLFLRIDERLNGSRSWMFYGSWLTAQLIFGLCLAQADYQFAGAGRREAYDFQRDYLRNHQPFLFN